MGFSKTKAIEFIKNMPEKEQKVMTLLSEIIRAEKKGLIPALPAAWWRTARPDSYKSIRKAHELAYAAQNTAATIEEQIAAINEAIPLDPCNESLWMLKLALIFDDNDLIDEAIDTANTILALNPAKASAWEQKAQLLYDLKSYEEALRCFDTAIELAPKWCYYQDKAGCLEELGRLKEALAAYDQALEIFDATDDTGASKTYLLCRKQGALRATGRKTEADALEKEIESSQNIENKTKDMN